MDGGTIYNINIESAIRQCTDMGYDESKIIIDALFCDSGEDPSTIEDGDNTWEYFKDFFLEFFWNPVDRRI